MWGLSNVTAGSNENIESFLMHPKLIGQVFNCIKSDILEIRREATFVITNAITTTDNPKYWLFITQFNHGEILKLLAKNLKINDAAIIIEIIQSLGHLIQLDKMIPLQGEDSIAYKLEVENVLDELENLQKHPNVKIYNEVEQFITNHFDSEPENEMIY